MRHSFVKQSSYAHLMKLANAAGHIQRSRMMEKDALLGSLWRAALGVVGRNLGKGIHNLAQSAVGRNLGRNLEKGIHNLAQTNVGKHFAEGMHKVVQGILRAGRQNTDKLVRRPVKGPGSNVSVSPKGLLPNIRDFLGSRGFLTGLGTTTAALTAYPYLGNGGEPAVAGGVSQNASGTQLQNPIVESQQNVAPPPVITQPSQHPEQYQWGDIARTKQDYGEQMRRAAKDIYGADKWDDLDRQQKKTLRKLYFKHNKSNFNDKANYFVPRYARQKGYSAQWTDPDTGEPMDFRLDPPLTQEEAPVQAPPTSKAPSQPSQFVRNLPTNQQIRHRVQMANQAGRAAFNAQQQAQESSQVPPQTPVAPPSQSYRNTQSQGMNQRPGAPLINGPVRQRFRSRFPGLAQAADNARFNLRGY